MMESLYTGYFTHLTFLDVFTSITAKSRCSYPLSALVVANSYMQQCLEYYSLNSRLPVRANIVVVTKVDFSDTLSSWSQQIEIR